jgi:hypothetical protein
VDPAAAVAGPEVERHMSPGRARSGEVAQGLAEFILILALITIVALGALLYLGGGLDTILSTIGANP